MSNKMEQVKPKKVNIYRRLSSRLAVCTSSKYSTSDYVPYTRVDSVDFKKYQSPKSTKPLKKQQAMTNLRPELNLNDTNVTFSQYFDKNEISVLHNINESFNPNTSLTSIISKPCSLESEEPSSADSSFNSGLSESTSLESLSSSRMYICCKQYSARLQGDVSLDEDEQVMMIVSTNEYTLVKKSNGDCGYVANDCIKISF